MNQNYLRPKSILIIRLGSLGDIILTTLMIRMLRDKWRNAKISMISKECYDPILDGIAHLDDRLYYPDSKSMRRSFRRGLKKRDFDTVIDLQNSIVSRTISSAVKPKALYRYHRPRLNRWMRIRIPSIRHKLATPPPVALGYLSVIKPYGIIDKGFGTELIVPEQWYDAVDAELSGALIVSPGAQHQTKMLPVKMWIELMTQAHANGMTNQVIIGGSSDVQTEQQIVNGLGHRVTQLAGMTDLGTLVATIKSGSLIVAGDSGPMHIAEAVGTPLVTIFGPTVTEFGFAPFRCKSEVIQINDLACRPCHPHGSDKCPKGHFKCMNDISVQSVLDAMNRLLQ